MRTHKHNADSIARTFKSHFIDEDAYGYLMENDINGFLNARAKCFIDYLFNKHFRNIMIGDQSR